MSININKATIKTIEGKEITVTEQTPIPCFRCGICCTRYQPALAIEEINNIASALGISPSKRVSNYTVKVPMIREGHLLKRTNKDCVFLTWDVNGRASCTIHPRRPKACREWTPSLSKPECLEGLAKLKSQGQIMLLDELFSSHDERNELCQSLKRDDD
jgi:Fe-S-cluster containining protein